MAFLSRITTLSYQKVIKKFERSTFCQISQTCGLAWGLRPTPPGTLKGVIALLENPLKGFLAHVCRYGVMPAWLIENKNYSHLLGAHQSGYTPRCLATLLRIRRILTYLARTMLAIRLRAYIPTCIMVFVRRTILASCLSTMQPTLPLLPRCQDWPAWLID